MNINVLEILGVNWAERNINFEKIYAGDIEFWTIKITMFK